MRRYAPLSKQHAGVTTRLGPSDVDKRQDGQRCNIVSYESSGSPACTLVCASCMGPKTKGSFIAESVDVFETDSSRISCTSKFTEVPLQTEYIRIYIFFVHVHDN